MIPHSLSLHSSLFEILLFVNLLQVYDYTVHMYFVVLMNANTLLALFFNVFIVPVNEVITLLTERGYLCSLFSYGGLCDGPI
jgi:hypothetical protein